MFSNTPFMVPMTLVCGVCLGPAPSLPNMLCGEAGVRGRRPPRVSRQGGPEPSRNPRRVYLREHATDIAYRLNEEGLLCRAWAIIL